VDTISKYRTQREPCTNTLGGAWLFVRAGDLTQADCTAIRAISAIVALHRAKKPGHPLVVLHPARCHHHADDCTLDHQELSGIRSISPLEFQRWLRSIC